MSGRGPLWCTHYRKPQLVPPIRDVVFFGESCSEKSSTTNVIAERVPAAAPQRTNAIMSIPRILFNIYDTTGLSEDIVGNVPNDEATEELFRLLNSLNTGVSVLVFCVRISGKMNAAKSRSWHLFYDIICRKEVPRSLGSKTGCPLYLIHLRLIHVIRGARWRTGGWRIRIHFLS